MAQQVAWVRVKPGSPTKPQVRYAVCLGALAVTGLFAFLGCLALLSSDPRNEATGYRMLKVAEVTGDIAESVCQC